MGLSIIERCKQTLRLTGKADHELTWIEQQEKLQSHKVQMLSCTVYDRSITRIRWAYEGGHYLAYTNADFNYLRGVMTVETETDRYDYFMGDRQRIEKNLKEARI